MEIHFVYAGDYYHFCRRARMRSFILNGMDNYKIKRVLVTRIHMHRKRLITKEVMENFCKGKEDSRKESVNDDLERLLEDIRLDKELVGLVHTYFLPKLTKEELKLVERKDYDFMHSFWDKMGADVDKSEMMLSESDSKFVFGYSCRTTIIENSLPVKH